VEASAEAFLRRRKEKGHTEEHGEHHIVHGAARLKDLRVLVKEADVLRDAFLGLQSDRSFRFRAGVIDRAMPRY
jgi:hypothetical protein